MYQNKTIDREEPFFYTGDLKSGLMVQTSDGGRYISDYKMYISASDISLVKRKIKQKLEIPMGSCRDNPSSGSLGRILQSKGVSPQQLCYVIPLLVEEGFCTAVKKRGAIIIKHYKCRK